MWNQILFVLFSSQKQSCPPENLKYLDQFNLSAYTLNPWYVQMQQVIIYSPNELYCIRDHIYPDSKQTEQQNQYWLQTTWNQKSVDGKQVKFNVHGIVNDLDRPSFWQVGPKIFPKFMRGDYWIVASSDLSDGQYEWVIVSGGAPKYPGKNGKCKLGTGFNGSGLWLMTRDAIVSDQMIKMLLSKTDELGYDTSILKRVEHKGCQYD